MFQGGRETRDKKKGKKYHEPYTGKRELNLLHSNLSALVRRKAQLVSKNVRNYQKITSHEWKTLDHLCLWIAVYEKFSVCVRLELFPLPTSCFLCILVRTNRVMSVEWLCCYVHRLMAIWILNNILKCFRLIYSIF